MLLRRKYLKKTTNMLLTSLACKSDKKYGADKLETRIFDGFICIIWTSVMPLALVAYVWLVLL